MAAIYDVDSSTFANIFAKIHGCNYSVLKIITMGFCFIYLILVWNGHDLTKKQSKAKKKKCVDLLINSNISIFIALKIVGSKNKIHFIPYYSVS